MRLTAPFPRTRDRTSVKPKPSHWFQQRWVFIPVILLLLAGVAFWWQSSQVTPVATTTVTVSQGNLTVTVSGSGTVAAARTVELPFQQSGTVTAVNVKVGDQVKSGQVLAQIDTSDLQLELDQAQANLKAVEAKLAQAKNGSATPQDITSGQASLDSAKAQLEKTRTGTATKSDIQSAQAQLTAAQAKLDALKNPTQADISAAQSKVDQAQRTLQSTRDSSSQTKTNAQLQLDNSVNALTQAQSKYATAQSNWQHVQADGTDPAQPSVTDATGKKRPNKLNDVQRQSYYDAFVQAQASLDSAQNAVTQAQVAYDNARQKEVLDIADAEAAVKDAQIQLDSLLNPTANDIAQTQASVVQAQANLDKLRQGGTAAEIAQARAQVVQAQASLDKLTAPAAEPDVAAAEASVLQAQVQANTAQHNLDQASLKAPFDGVVSAVTVQPGSTIGSGTTATITLIDRSKLHVEVSLSETDAARVQVGQPVIITFDALPNIRITGKVITVAPAATVQQNVVTYPVQVEFEAHDPAIKVGMSTTADIQVQQIENAILVPSRAVQTVGNTHVVTVLQGENKTPVSVEVETGATSNGQTEITSCVQTGSQCLRVGDQLAVSATTTRTTTQQNRGFGGGGFGGPVIRGG